MRRRRIGRGLAWSDSDDAKLRRSFTAGGVLAALRALPKRTRPAVWRRARRLGLQREPQWPPQDDATLRELWAQARPLHEVAARFQRSQEAVAARAHKLGLRRGCPDGWEYVTAAARRTGFDEPLFRKVLAAAQVEVRPALTFHQGRTSRRTEIVHSEGADLAVAHWMTGAPLAVQARRYGVACETMERRLAKVGVRRPRPRRHWHVSDADVARAMGA